MFDTQQLNSIGFRFVSDSVEVMSPYGEELKRRPRLYTRKEADELKAEQRNIESLIGAVKNNVTAVNRVMRFMMPLKDIRRSIKNLGERTLSEVELFELKRFLLQLELLAPAAAEIGGRLSGVEIFAIPEALDIIDPDGTRSPSFYVSDRLSERLAQIRRERRLVDEAMKKGDASVELTVKRTRLAAEEDDENARVCGVICERLRPFTDGLLRNIGSIARLDFALGKARLAERMNAVIPEVGSEEFTVNGMVNPCFAEGLEAKGRSFVPVSMKLELGSVVITGANMGGKSIAIKTLALNALLAMSGFAVFAESMKLPFLDDMFIMSEDREDARSGLSSFGGEMKAFDNMLRETEEKESILVLLDEFARGTNPHEGAALVRAAAKLFNLRNNTYAVIATHFDGVAKLARLHYQVAGLRNTETERLSAELKAGGTDLLASIMDYGLYPVSKDEEPPRDAVKIIRAMGVSGEFSSLIDNIQ